MEKGENNDGHIAYSKPSEFLTDCYEQIKFLTFKAQEGLRNCNQITYRQLLMEKGRFMIDLKDYADFYIEQGLPIPQEVVSELEAIRNDAYDLIEHAAVYKEYHPLDAMLIQKNDPLHNDGNRLKFMIQQLEEQDL
ncbi:MAG TPA: hypothetical protein VMR51_01810 [Patescibacteria group bacterium]|nr:hypothetical protein [Patescibacteria group bacterium]